MTKKTKIINIIQEKKVLEKQLDELIYGSIEIRETKQNKYIYVHYNNNGIQTTKYIDKFSNQLYEAIINNSIKAKILKKKIYLINKQLKQYGYQITQLNKKVELNIDIAKRYMIQTIYKQAILEGIATTYINTETIIKDGKINNMSLSDVTKIINLKHAWEFILNENIIQLPTDYFIVCEINKLVEENLHYNAGKLRTVPVSISGTTWEPLFPIETIAKETIQNIIYSNLDDIDKAIELLLYIMKAQLFLDGNKRTAVIFANHFMISKGLGIIVIPNDKIQEFRQLLIKYYENSDIKSIKIFLKKECYQPI